MANSSWKQIKSFIDDLNSPSLLNHIEKWDSHYVWFTYQDLKLDCDIVKDSDDSIEFETYYMPHIATKVADGVERSSSQIFYQNSNSITAVSEIHPLPVAGAGGVNNITLVIYAIDTSNYNLITAPYSQNTNINNDYILDSVDLKFDSSATKTITISTVDGTILWGGGQDTSITNLGYNTTSKNFNLVFDQAFDANKNIKIDVTQTDSSCVMSCVTKIKREQSTILEIPAVKLIDSNGAAYGIDHIGNKLRTSSVKYTTDVAKNNISGAAVFRGFGERESVAVEINGVDVWRGPTSIIPLPSHLGQQMAIVSTSTQDVSGDVGVASIYIHYIDTDGNTQSLEISLNGTTVVYTPITNIAFINEVHTSSVGSNGVAVGDIKIFKPDDTNVVYNLIKAGGNMSLSAIRKIPNNKTFFLTRFSMSVSGNKPTAVRIRSTDHHGVVYNGNSPIYLFKDTVFIGEGSISNDFDPPIVMPGGSIVKVSAWATQTGAMISSSFNGWYENA